MQKTTFRRLNFRSFSPARQSGAGRFSQFCAAMLLGLVVAGCSTSGTEQAGVATSGEPRVTQAELQAFCPRITLREGTSFFNSYEKGGNGDSNRVIYQASIAEVTRDCRRDGGNLTINVAAAGRIVPGPKFRSGSLTMPIRVVVMQGDKVLSSTLRKQVVPVTNAQSATQFLFSEASVSVPEVSSRSLEIFIGFDEGLTKG